MGVLLTSTELETTAGKVPPKDAKARLWLVVDTLDRAEAAFSVESSAQWPIQWVLRLREVSDWVLVSEPGFLLGFGPFPWIFFFLPEMKPRNNIVY